MSTNTSPLRSYFPSRISLTRITSTSSRRTKLLSPWVLPMTGVSSMVLLNGNHGVRSTLTLKLTLSKRVALENRAFCLISPNKPPKEILLKCTLFLVVCAKLPTKTLTPSLFPLEIKLMLSSLVPWLYKMNWSSGVMFPTLFTYILWLLLIAITKWNPLCYNMPRPPSSTSIIYKLKWITSSPLRFSIPVVFPSLTTLLWLLLGRSPPMNVVLLPTSISLNTNNNSVWISTLILFLKRRMNSVNTIWMVARTSLTTWILMSSRSKLAVLF